MPAEKYRVQGKVCAAMAEGSPSEEIRRLWLELARHYELAAEAALPQRNAQHWRDSADSGEQSSAR